MKPGDLVRIRPSGWGIFLRSYPLFDSSRDVDDDVRTFRGAKVTPDEVLTVLEIVHDEGPGPEPHPAWADVRVLTSRGAVGYVARVRLEVIK